MSEITPMHVGSAIGVILILLGFFALLTQKIYIDPKTSSPSEIEVPILGKMKANYPALIFVFLGCSLVAFGITRYESVQDVPWLIDGSITSRVPGVNWQRGQLAVFPSNVDVEIHPESGEFFIGLEIEKGKTFEDEIERIQYSHPTGNMIIVPKTEFDLKRSRKNSKLVTETPTSRRYKVNLEPMPQSE